MSPSLTPCLRASSTISTPDNHSCHACCGQCRERSGRDALLDRASARESSDWLRSAQPRLLDLSGGGGGRSCWLWVSRRPRDGRRSGHLCGDFRGEVPLTRTFTRCVTFGPVSASRAGGRLVWCGGGMAGRADQAASWKNLGNVPVTRTFTQKFQGSAASGPCWRGGRGTWLRQGETRVTGGCAGDRRGNVCGNAAVVGFDPPSGPGQGHGCRTNSGPGCPDRPVLAA